MRLAISESVSRLLPLLGGRRGTLGGSAGMHSRGGGVIVPTKSVGRPRVRVPRRPPLPLLPPSTRRVLVALSFAMRKCLQHQTPGKHNGHRQEYKLVWMSVGETGSLEHVTACWMAVGVYLMQHTVSWCTSNGLT